MSILKKQSDYLYDNNFIVSGAKDHYKHMYYAKIGNGPNKNNYVFYIVDEISAIALPVPKLNLDDHSSITFAIDSESNLQETFIKTQHQQVQTKYRCSSAQTSPWQPPYEIMDSGDPELLKLDFLKWGVGLPVGKHEIVLIERARMKQRWNKAIPPVDSTMKSIQENANTIKALEREQWAFREQEIHAMQELRLELLEQMLRELLRNSKIRSEMKLKMYSKMRQAEKNEKLQKLQRNCEREKRRLKWAHTGVITKYHKDNIVNEMANKKSEVYAPLMRNGNNPKYWHFNLEKASYKCQYIGVERFKVVPQWLQDSTKIHDKDIKLPGTRLCIRETKWTEPVLKQLHDELKGLRKKKQKKCTLRIKIDRIPDEPPTPEVDAIEEEEEEIYQASVLIQEVLRGRASQILIFEGRDRCRELIEELRSSHAVLQKDITEKFENKQQVKLQQRGEEVCLRNINKVQEALKRLEGSVVGTLLDFLNKELTRLLDERQAHALCLMADRDRQIREAAEAGKRQLELRRRQEHDEMFKQVAKVTQDTVDLYLQDIITEGMEFASTEDAKVFVQKIAKKLDDLNAECEKNRDDINYQEDMIADLVHHFVLPEVEKKIVREKYKNRQAKYLRVAHKEIYTHMEKLKVDRKLQASKLKAKMSQQVKMKRTENKKAQKKENVTIIFDNTQFKEEPKGE